MKRLFPKLKSFFVALLVGVAVMLPCFSVQASESPYILLDSRRDLSDVISDVNAKSNKLASFKFLSSKDSGDGATVRIDKEKYNDLKIADKREIMSNTLMIIQKSSMPAKERSRLYNFISDQDTATSAVVRQLSTDVNADYATAWTWFKPFSGITGTLLGFIAICIVAFVALSTVVDLAYLTLPMMQVMLDPTTGEKPKWISNEAYSSRKDAERDQTRYKDCLWIYFKRRAKMMFALGICLGYLLNGQIFMLIGRVMDTIGTIIE